MIAFPSLAALTFRCALVSSVLLAPSSLVAIGAEAETASPLQMTADSLHLSETPIAAGDVLTLRVGSWNLVEELYQDWTGVGGDVTVQGDGTIMVPFAGSVHAAGLAPAAIAEEISARLRAVTGVEGPPTVVVEIARRSPIYVSGDVMSPGEIEFREGLTVRQAVALAGGPLRVLPSSEGGLLGRQVQIRESILRADLRIARLEAELAKAESFELPEGVGENEGLESLVAVERRLMQARQAALAAQTVSVDELIAVLVGVKSGLEEQIELVEGEVERAQEEVSRRRELLDRGLMRETDVANAETGLSNLMLRLVDMNTQRLTVEKDLSEARRGRDTLGQAREIEILQELGDTRDGRRDLELEAALFGVTPTSAGSSDPAILLIEARGQVSRPVEPETRLRPGDTLVIEASTE